jgi:hypothetical protein
MAQFDSPESILTAAKESRKKGYKNIQAYTPFPVEELSETLGFNRDGVAFITLVGGLSGAFFGYMMQWYAYVIDYPLNVGGRPFNSWPAFIPITFELTILFAALFAVFGMLSLNRLPQPYHPVFNVKEFDRSSTDGFFLCIFAHDPLFRLENTRTFLESLSPLGVYEVDL